MRHDDWAMTGDPCPRCGGSRVYILGRDVESRDRGRLRSSRSRGGARNPRHRIYCAECRYSELRRGLPRQFRPRSGDYTAERGKWLDGLSLEELVSEIKGRRRKARRTKG